VVDGSELLHALAERSRVVRRGDYDLWLLARLGLDVEVVVAARAVLVRLVKVADVRNTRTQAQIHARVHACECT